MHPAPSERDERHETTDLLRRWAGGEAEAANRLLERLYPELRRMASRHSSRMGRPLEPSDLVQEIYLRMSAQESVGWENRAHFFALAARFCRRVLTDDWRRRHQPSKGFGVLADAASEQPLAAGAEEAPDHDLMALNQALERLEVVDELAVRIVELRHFTGLTVEETASVCGASRATVVRRWRWARAWLARELGAT